MLPDTPGEPDRPNEPTNEEASTDQGYKRLHRIVLLCTITVSVTPLLLMTFINYYHYDHAARSESKYAMQNLACSIKRSLEFFLNERLAELIYITHDKTIAELQSDDELARILDNMNASLPQRAFVDLGLIDSTGKQLSYVGPYELQNRNYTDQPWFQEVYRRGTYVSDVFLGHRQSPHFVIAVSCQDARTASHVVRATIDTRMLEQQIAMFGPGSSSDCFIVDQDLTLQTPSRRYGDTLSHCPLALPPLASETVVVDWQDEFGHSVILACAQIKNSPFILIMVNRPNDIMGRWLSLRGKLLVFLLVSIAIMVSVIFWGSHVFVKRLRLADAKRARLLHNIEYTNKLASLGRLAAGTAHEINNPLAIVKENAGLLHDLVTLNRDEPIPPDKAARLAEAIQRGVDRCAAITHRLLGFAKCMDVRYESIDLKHLIEELLAFHGKDATHRDLQVEVRADVSVPLIESDRGQLQQVFLNLINNAFAAVHDNGHIQIEIGKASDDAVRVTVSDNGVGIEKEHLSRVFEPFFTTKGDYGTGLGLSVTYGIVQRLGGRISVESERGVGTCFTVVLPVKHKG